MKTTTKPTKSKASEAAEHCQQVKSFVTYACYAYPPFDFLGDDNGDVIIKGTTHELMHSPEVRIIIEPGTNKADVVRLLKEILKWVKSAPGDIIVS